MLQAPDPSTLVGDDAPLAGEELGVDASGNRKLGDIGLVLRRELERHFAGRGRPFAS